MVALLMPLPMTDDTTQTARSFGTWLMHELDVRGWSKSDFARRSGFDRSVISRWVADTRRPGLESAKAIADALNVDVAIVLTRLGLGIPAGDDLERERLQAMLSGLRLTPERSVMLAQLLQMWSETDREARGG